MAKTFWGSRHKWTYIKIAIKHFTTPKRVFELAHGKEEMHSKDLHIMHDLKVAGIIHKRRHRSRSEK